MPIAIHKRRRIRPVRLPDAWLGRGAITDGAVFRRLKGVLTTSAPTRDSAAARVVQACDAAAGYDPARVAGHLLRAGFRHGRRSRRNQSVQTEGGQPAPQHGRARILSSRRSLIRGTCRREVPVRDSPGVIPRKNTLLS